MKLLLLTVIVFSVSPTPARAEYHGGFGYELTMAMLEGMQTNSIVMEADLKSVITKVDRLMDDRRLSTKMDDIMAVLARLTDKLADNTRTTASQLDSLRDGMQNNIKALERDLNAISTKVSNLAIRVDQMTGEQSKLTDILNVNSKAVATKLDRIMDGKCVTSRRNVLNN